MKYTILHWLDSTTSHGWQTRQDIAQHDDVISVGLLVDEDDRRVILCNSRAFFGNLKPADCDLQCPHTVPKRAIIHREDFELPNWAEEVTRK